MHLVAKMKTGDAAYIALEDLSTVLAGHSEARIIGGHMVSLTTTAFPTPRLTPRRTGDVDAGIPVELASSNALHDALLGLGYGAHSDVGVLAHELIRRTLMELPDEP
ncbi:hypothetical protein [Curtobacterium sp. MCBD17_030]|uniref:hypothetical protein n=1 Tax=Curtobacterium sp. MCBD17_030 TaxID=2175649 RepID=UPI0011B667FF|nr:hypothetical protein [Curtobacterium sp. MCBD17_030]